MKKTLLTSMMVVSFIAPFANAKTAMDRSLESKKILGLVYEDETTGEKCLVSSEANILSNSNLVECSDKQKEEMKEINDAPKNPELAFAGLVVDLALSYYTLCSSVQASPYLLGKVLEGTDDRTRTEKVKDFFVPSEEQREKDAAKGAVDSFAKDVGSTICRPVYALNKKLIYLVSEEK